MTEKINLLFLCTGNSCRSQMAEGWTRLLKGDIITPFSAGIETHGLNPYAVKVMAEVGIDISRQRSKLVDEFMDINFTAVITVCSHAYENCPWFPGSGKVIHVGFDDPPQLAKNLADQGADTDAQLNCYRKVRDEIKAFVETLPQSLQLLLKLKE